MLFVLIYSVLASDLKYAIVSGDTEYFGYYYIDIWVGSPKVLQTVILDTGSRITAFPCAGCSDCGSHLDSYFDYHKSFTSRLVTCSEGISCKKCVNNLCWYSQDYAEGSSIEGVLIEDILLIGDDFSNGFEVRAVIGCHRKETKQFRTQIVDGIMGLGFAKNRVWTIVDLMQRNQENDIFSLCLAKKGGVFTVGGANFTMHEEDVKWGDLYDTIYYSVLVNGISVGDYQLVWDQSDYNPYYTSGTIIDSGSTFTYFREKTWTKLINAIKNYCGTFGKCLGKRVNLSTEPNDCYEYLPGQSLSTFFASFPKIALLIDKEKVFWLGTSYLFAWPDSPNIYCIGIYNNGSGGNILGGNFMRGMNTIFDRKHKKIGFAHSICDSSFIHRDYKGPSSIIIPPTSNNSFLYLFLMIFTILSLIFLYFLLTHFCKKKRTPLKRKIPPTDFSKITKNLP